MVATSSREAAGLARIFSSKSGTRQAGEKLTTASNAVASADKEFKKAEQTKSTADHELQLAKTALQQTADALTQAKAAMQLAEADRDFTAFAERAPREEIHHQVGETVSRAATVENPRNVGVVEAGENLFFCLEALHQPAAKPARTPDADEEGNERAATPEATEDEELDDVRSLATLADTAYRAAAER